MQWMNPLHVGSAKTAHNHQFSSSPDGHMRPLKDLVYISQLRQRVKKNVYWGEKKKKRKLDGQRIGREKQENRGERRLEGLASVSFKKKAEEENESFFFLSRQFEKKVWTNEV